MSDTESEIKLFINFTEEYIKALKIMYTEKSISYIDYQYEYNIAINFKKRLEIMVKILNDK